MDEQTYAEAQAAYNQVAEILKESALANELEFIDWYHDEPRWLLLRNGVETFSIDVIYSTKYPVEKGRFGRISEFQIRGTVLENGFWRTVFGPESISVEKALKQKGSYQFEVRVPKRMFLSLLTKAIDETIQYVKEKRK